MATIWSSVVKEDLSELRELLEEGGVGVNSINDLGETPLHLAASRGLEDVAKMLLDHGANVSCKDWESGWTPLHRCLYFGHIRVALLLLQAGALLDGGREDASTKNRRARARSRSESLGFAPKRSDGLGDNDGNTPLGILSLGLRPQLKTAREMGRGGDVYSMGKADFFLGYDSFGQAEVIRPRRVEALANLQVVRVAASKYHSAAVTVCGKLFTWGHGRGGRLGHGSEEVAMLPTLVEGLASHMVTDVGASEMHTAALTTDGDLYTWGSDRFGQLGHGSGSSGRLVPKRVEGLRKVSVVAVATGTEHTAIVTSSGECYTWGRNKHGQLGVAGVTQQSSPRTVSYLASGASRGSGGVGRHVIKVSASARSTVVVTRGVDRGSGRRPVNEVHQWGHGSHVPSRVSFSNMNDDGPSSRWRTHDARVNITDVAAAKCHNLALSSVGQVFTWGFGADNLGLNPRETRTARGPQLVAAMLPENCGGNAVHISASDQHSCVVTDTGDLYTWGTAGEEGGALGHGGKNRWQPVAKRVSCLKKVASVAAAPDHTMVLLQAFCPLLPHGASLTASSAQANGVQADRSLSRDPQLEKEEEEEGTMDSDSEFGDVEEGGGGRGGDVVAGRRNGIVTTRSDGVSEPLTLKQHCEMVLAREVDLSNASSLLAYADALDAPALVKYCAEFVSSNLDGILVVGRESDRCCLLETSGDLASSLLRTGGFARARRSFPPMATERAAPEDSAAFDLRDDEEGVNREAMATALARAEMRAKTPSTKVAARAVRSLKKKIARIAELEGLRDNGKDLSVDQAMKVGQKSRMEAELSSLDSELERAKLAQAARARRHEVEGIQFDIEEEAEAHVGKESPSAKRALFTDKKTSRPDPQARPSEGTAKADAQWTPQLDLLQCEEKTNDRRPIKCEACLVECADASMYADHLRGKRHRATMSRLEAQLHEAAKTSQSQSTPRTWANISVHDSHASCSAAAKASTSSSATTQLPTAGHSRAGNRGGRAACPEVVNDPPAKPRVVPNQLPRGGDFVSMRQTLEKQQRAATMVLAGDPSKQQEPTADAAHVMSSLRSTGATGGTVHDAASQRSPPPLEAATTAARAAYSLVDFIAAPETKKSQRRKSAPKNESQGKAGHVWGAQDCDKTAAVADTPASSTESKVLGPEEPLRTRKSFHAIIEEEEREKKERDEYGESVWFVSRKPRSTSFEGIVQQQRREELVAEEERKRAVEDEMEEEMLRLVLEMSKKDAQPGQSSHGNRASEKGREGGGRRARHRKPTPGAKTDGSGPRRIGKTEGEPSHAPSSGGRPRRTRRPHHEARCSTVSDPATKQSRQGRRQETSAP